MAEIKKAGYLTKEGGGIKSWHKRWFVLEEGVLSYYDKEGGKQKGAIMVGQCGSVRAIAYKDKKHCFKIVTKGREYMVYADDQQTMSEWIEALTAVRKAIVGKDTTFEKSKLKVGLADFEMLKVIGRGSFGRVLMVKFKQTDQVMAMKVLDKKRIIENDELKSMRAEKSILAKLNCHFLVKLYFSFQTPDKVYFVMDYINGGELFFHLQNEQKFSPERTRFYVAQILLGVQYLHDRGIIYRDLKPENILLTSEGHICMTDFGISKEGLSCADDRTATFCGTPEYLAPEVLLGNKYGKEVDWWSLGTLMFEMLTSMPPFYEEDVQLMYQKIMKEEIDYSPVLEVADEVAVDFLKCILTRDPAERQSDPEVLKQHPYFAGLDWEAMYNKEITPPYIPPVSAEDDTSQFDETFTRENPSLSVSEPLSEDDQAKFVDFTYVGAELPLDSANFLLG
eukprot:CAMPEP_0174256576 /NCGR_PEP_ID=MMETSP0439-20130205/5797_1 /TAXON_ID=0 /ORGANISM="Stereomyxa ramosa, Strain Chinc5" /LENGTH=450 /DNA_ID=CAMNT_0015339247 /DNA_START=43 /DNA_END=1395 /DNA_ORIENTATION=-